MDPADRAGVICHAEEYLAIYIIYAEGLGGVVYCIENYIYIYIYVYI